MPQEQALARRTTDAVEVQSNPVIRSEHELMLAVEQWKRQHFNVLVPAVNLGFAPQHALVVSTVSINPDELAGEVYRDKLWCKEDEVALTKVGLSKIQQCAGINFDTVDLSGNPPPQNYWKVKAVVWWKGTDGSVQRASATEELDLRDGSPRIGPRDTPGQTRAARAKGYRNCEARAINAAIRQFGVRQKYRKAELAKPFVVARVMFMPDMNDAAQRQMFAAASMGSASALGYPQSLPPAPQTFDIGNAQVIDHEPTTETPSTPNSSAPEKPPVESKSESKSDTKREAETEARVPAGFGVIRGIEEKELNKRGGGKFTKYFVTDASGQLHVTVYSKFAAQLKDTKKADIPVKLVSEENDYGDYEIKEILEFDPRQQRMPLEDDL